MTDERTESDIIEKVKWDDRPHERKVAMQHDKNSIMMNVILQVDVEVENAGGITSAIIWYHCQVDVLLRDLYSQTKQGKYSY